MTVDVKLQNYISILPKQWSTFICMFKCANHKLPVVTGRYGNIALEHRLCILCKRGDIGDEIHYLFYCYFFTNSRKKYMEKYYYNIVNVMKIGQLFNTKKLNILLNLAKFVKEIFVFFKANR